MERFGLNGSFAQKFHEVNTEREWKDKKGKPYQNWKNLMRIWTEKEDNLAQYKPKPKVDTSMVHR